MERPSPLPTEATPQEMSPHEEPNTNPTKSNEVWHEVQPTMPGSPASDPQPDPLAEADQRSLSIYWSLRSFSASTLSLFNLSSGRPSQDGATWDQAIHLTNNSGFGPAGTPRSMGNKGVREGRERGGFLPRLRGVGRTGKEPYAVPTGMLKALGVVKEEPSVADEDPPITYLREMEADLKRDIARLAVWADEPGCGDKLVPLQAPLYTLEVEFLPSQNESDLTPLHIEIFDRCYLGMLSIRAQLKTLVDQKLDTQARVAWEEATLDRATRGSFRNYNTRRYLENLIREDYETGVRRPRRTARDYGVVVVEPYRGLLEELESNSAEDVDEIFCDCLPETRS